MGREGILSFARRRGLLRASISLTVTALVLGPAMLRADPDDADAAWEAARADLRDALEADEPNPDLLDATLTQVAQLGGERAVRVLTDAAVVHCGSGDCRLVARSVASIDDPAARDYVVAEARRRKGGARSWLCLLALAASDWPEARPVLVDTIESARPFLGVEAVLALRRQRTAAAVETLVDALAAVARLRRSVSDRDVVAEAIRQALVDLTGAEHEDVDGWRAWWQSRGESFTPAPERNADDDDRDDEERIRTVVREAPETRTRPRLPPTVARLRGDDVLVVRGNWDVIDEVLDDLGIPYRRVARKRLASERLDPERQVVVIGCGGHAFPRRAVEKLRDFVREGGYLFTSDYGLTQVLEPAFPGAASKAGSSGFTELDVAIGPAAGAGESSVARHLLHDVFSARREGVPPPRWKVDPSSYTIAPGPETTVLVESAELAKSLGHGAVAVTFRRDASSPRRGRRRGRGDERPSTGGARWASAERRTAHDLRGGAVLHVIGHFAKQRNADGDGFALQQLFLNFLDERQASIRAAASRS